MVVECVLWWWSVCDGSGGGCVMVGVECVLWWGWSVCHGRGGVCVMVGVECVRVVECVLW